MYRDELAAAQAHNDVLRRRIAELETTSTNPSKSLINLVERGRKARVKRAARAERARVNAAKDARKQAEIERLSKLRWRAERVHKACARVNLLKNLHVPLLVGFGVLMCLMPALIFSAVLRWIILPASAACLLWPVIALGLNAAINRRCVSAEASWVNKLPFPLAGHFETLESNDLEKKITLAITHRGPAPEAAIVADLIAGVADTSRGLVRVMLERTSVQSNGEDMWLTAYFANTDAGRNREYRVWSHAAVGVLDQLREHFPITCVEVRASSS